MLQPVSLPTRRAPRLPRPSPVQLPAVAPATPAGLPEFRLYRPRPGHPDWPRLAAEARDLAAQLRPVLERPRTGWRALRRRLRAQGTTAWNYGRNVLRARRGREDLLPLYFIWTTTRVCNFACTYCDDHRGSKYPDLSNEGVLDTEQGRELLRILRTGTPSVYFAGGEPTLRKDLPELTRAARDLDYYPLVVNTNASAIGRLLAKPAWRTWLADIDIVVVSLDGLGLRRLGDLWVYKRPEDVVRTLLLLRELRDEFGFKLMVNTVIHADAVDEARDVLDLCNDLGIGFCPVPMNIGPEVDRTLLDHPEYDDLVRTILQRKADGHAITGSVRLNARLLRGAPLNCRNTLKPHVDFDGRLYWPCKAAVNRGPERIDVLDFPDVDTLYEAACSRIDPTGFHGPGPEQCGASCNWAQNYTTDAYARGLRRPLGLVGEVAGFLRSS